MQNNTPEKYFIWFIQGGLGKNIAATSLVESIKNSFPNRKLILVASWPQVFLNNPYIDKVYAGSNIPHFYENYVKDKDIIVCNHEPYHQTGHITKQNHLIKSWCELLNIPYKNQQPQIFYNYAEQKKYSQTPSQKPILVLQTTGGPFDENTPYNWTRDIPIEISEAIVEKYSQEYEIVQITKPSGYTLNNVKRIDQQMSNLNLFAILSNSSKRILIDSCLQHAAAALNLPSTVLWIGTSSKVFGYQLHNNITANTPKITNQLIDSGLFDYQFSNNQYQCPYMDIEEMFSPKILNQL